MVPLHFPLTLSPISTSEQDRRRTGNAKCYGAVRNINSVIKVFSVSHLVSDPFSSHRITAAHLWWDILSSTVNYLDIHFLRFNIKAGDLCKSYRYTDYSGALNWFNVKFRFCAMNIEQYSRGLKMSFHLQAAFKMSSIRKFPCSP